MARLPRYAAPGIPQHVIQRGVNRSVMFVAGSDYRFFGECLRAACVQRGCQLHAYVFMTNHVHLLMTPTTASSIAKVVQSVGRRYVRCFNDTYQRTGTLWEGRYKATLVDSEQYFLACHRYIELNPVRAGAADPLVTPHERYQGLGTNANDRQRAYRALCGALPDSTIADIRDATNRGWALGGKRFRDEMATLLARRTQPGPRGRRLRRNDENRV